MSSVPSAETSSGPDVAGLRQVAALAARVRENVSRVIVGKSEIAAIAYSASCMDMRVDEVLISATAGRLRPGLRGSRQAPEAM